MKICFKILILCGVLHLFSLSPPIVYGNTLIENNCLETLQYIVKSSNFPFRFSTKNDAIFSVDSKSNNNIIIQITYKMHKDDIKYTANINNIDPPMSISDWVMYDTLKVKLYNISGNTDPDDPTELNFNTKYVEQFKQCIKKNTEERCRVFNQEIKDKQMVFPVTEDFLVSKKGRVYFYFAPHTSCQISNKLFIIHNDIVKVNSEYENFFNVIFTKKNGTTVGGWIYKDTLKPTKNNLTFKDDFPKYCVDLKENQVFDGTDEYFCKYPNLNLFKTYQKIKQGIDEGVLLKETIKPMENIIYAVSDGNINYQWINQQELKIIISLGAEITTYIFKEFNNRTEVKIQVKTGY